MARSPRDAWSSDSKPSGSRLSQISLDPLIDWDTEDSFLRRAAGNLFESNSRTPEAPQPDDPTPPLEPEERYSKRGVLGQGGHATVVRAYDRQLHRLIALKLLTRPHTPWRRVLREARAQARVQHAHILDVYEVGTFENTPYIAMRHIQGTNLANLPESTSVIDKVQIFIQVAYALFAAHTADLLHRDIKPSNILVETTPTGPYAWVADFGIAIYRGSVPETSKIAGTPAYIAPEIFDCQQLADHRADIYSLGVTMYQVLYGRLPNPRPRCRPNTLSPSQSDGPWTGLNLRWIISKAMATDPNHRHVSARDIATDLIAWLFNALR